MKAKTLLSDYWKPCLSALFALAVYCYWYFLYPHIMLGREQSQLFLLNREYFLERIALPGGFAQYVGEFIVQFFVVPAYGAICYALLFLLAQYFVWRMMRRAGYGRRWFYLLSFVPSLLLWWLGMNVYVPMTFTVAVVFTLAFVAFLPRAKRARLVSLLLFESVGYWLLGPVVVLALPCCWRWSPVLALLLAFCVLGSARLVPYPLRQVARGIDYFWSGKHLGSIDEMAFDKLLRQKKWGEMVDLYSQSPSPSVAMQSAATLAMFQTGRIGEPDLMENISVSSKSLSSQSAAFIMSEVYMNMRMNNLAQRAAFEAMESVPNHGKSGRAIQRLAETNLVAGQADVALKYISILSETLFYRGWAERLRPLALNPELVKNHPIYGQLQKIHNGATDIFVY